MPCAVVRRVFFIGEKRRRPHHIYLMCSKRRMRTMTMAELYAAPEKLDGGAAMVETIKAEVGKVTTEQKISRSLKSVNE